jgi:hypothetical protein
MLYQSRRKRSHNSFARNAQQIGAGITHSHVPVLLPRKCDPSFDQISRHRVWLGQFGKRRQGVRQVSQTAEGHGRRGHRVVDVYGAEAIAQEKASCHISSAEPNTWPDRAVRHYLSMDGKSWTPDIVYALVFLIKADAEHALVESTDATGIADGRERWYAVKDEVT